MKIPFILNNESNILDVDPGMRLIDILRDRFKLTKAKSGCYSGRCGNCMVLINEKPVLSCLVPAAIIRNAKIETVEHISKTDTYADITLAFEQAGITLCGFCDAGKMLIAYNMLETKSRLTKDEIRAALSGSLCTCTDTESLISGIRIAFVLREKRFSEK